MILPHIALDKIRKGAILLDVRTRESYDLWHLPEAKCFPYDEVEDNLNMLDKNKDYILVCAAGIGRSEEIEKKLKEKGFQAEHVFGGLIGIMEALLHQQQISEEEYEKNIELIMKGFE
jgi:rhodanese-related sulfurtransferase